MLAAAIMRDGKEGVLILNFFSFFILEKKQFHPQYAMPSISALLCPLMLRLEGAAAVLFKVSTSVFFGFKTNNHNDSRKYNTEVQRAPQAKHNSEYRLCYLTN
mgnify:CR=1 FL=1